MANHRFSKKFWTYVDKRGDDECWPWTRATAPNTGYGRAHYRDVDAGRTVCTAAHRVAYRLAYGPIQDGLCVCHRCDNPPCCNPSHLFLGTVADNNRDRKLKGRNGTTAFTGFSTDPPRGEKNRHAKLTAEQVQQLRAQYAAGTLNQMATARRLGVHASTIQRLIKANTWKHVA